jgi:hypothetical protein
MGLLATAMACMTMACSGAPAAEPAATPPPFALHFEKSGGLKPMPEELTIRPGRRAVATLGVSGSGESRTVRFRVSRRKVSILRKGLRRSHFFALGSSPPGRCADCFVYTIDYRGHRVSVDQSSISSQLAGVVTKLETIVFTHAVMPSPGELPHLPFH